MHGIQHQKDFEQEKTEGTGGPKGSPSPHFQNSLFAPVKNLSWKRECAGGAACRGSPRCYEIQFKPQVGFRLFLFLRIYGYLFAGMGALFVLLGWAVAICTFISGRYLARRQCRIFSFVMAAILCMFFPFGTVLGVFTIIILMQGVGAAAL